MCGIVRIFSRQGAEWKTVVSAMVQASRYRGPLREWAEELLDEGRLRREGYLHSAPIRRKWAEHLSGRRNWQYVLWNVLMFQVWNER